MTRAILTAIALLLLGGVAFVVRVCSAYRTETQRMDDGWQGR